MITDKEIICRIDIKETDTGHWIAYDTKTFLTISDIYEDYSECLKDISQGLFDYTPFK